MAKDREKGRERDTGRERDRESVVYASIIISTPVIARIERETEKKIS